MSKAKKKKKVKSKIVEISAKNVEGIKSKNWPESMKHFKSQVNFMVEFFMAANPDDNVEVTTSK